MQSLSYIYILNSERIFDQLFMITFSNAEVQHPAVQMSVETRGILITQLIISCFGTLHTFYQEKKLLISICDREYEKGSYPIFQKF